MREVAGTSSGIARRQVMRVTTVEDLHREWTPELTWLVLVMSDAEARALARVANAGVPELVVCTQSEVTPMEMPHVVVTANDLIPGDVVAVTPGRKYLQVLYRESDSHHTVFLTNRCNSNCIMCSQPPTKIDDSWLIDEARCIASHMRRSPPILGFTGGEPLLLGEALREILETFHAYHPNTIFDVLTNGRLLSDRQMAAKLLGGLEPKVRWMIPLYGHADFLHDSVVRAAGAFDQTIDGLLTLHEFRQPVQLRTVLVDPVLRILPELCRFVAKNLPFVREVALMGCEPIGFALANRADCHVDIADWTEQIGAAVAILRLAEITPVVMNVPLCALPEHLRRYAHRSISDWKQVYGTECSTCMARAKCCGLFAWHERGWQPTAIKPMAEVT